jgi:hypothetical protein
MSYNGSGTFQINTSGQPVVTGTVISSTTFNALTADLATGLSTAITKDGQTATTVRIPFAQGITSTLVTDSSSISTGSIITAGGIGVAKAAYIGTTLNVASTASATKFIPTSSSVTGNGLYLPAANALGLSTNGTNAVYIDSSQNVGIGTSSPGVKLDVNGALRIGLASNPTTIASNSQFYDQSGVGPTISGYNFTVRTGNPTPAEAMRIDSSGNLLVGTTSQISSAKVSISGGGGGGGLAPLAMVNPAQATRTWNCGPDNGGNFGVTTVSGTNGQYIAYGATVWSSTSDERLKTPLIPFENAVEKVCSLRAGTGRYLKDEESVSRVFLIAQDVQAVLPEAVNVQDDEIGTLGLAYTDVIPLLVASIKELKALVDTQASTITALTARIEALENK